MLADSSSTGPLILALTGGIASGKSFVAGIMRECGIPVIDSDALGHQVIEPGGRAYDSVVAEFGDSILRKDGAIDHKILASVVFSDPARKKNLESLTHPHIFGLIAERASDAVSSGARVVVVESALIFELGIKNYFAKVITVYVDPSTQLARLIERDRCSREEALLKISSQIPLDAKAKMSEIVIDNSGSFDGTRKATIEIISGLGSFDLSGRHTPVNGDNSAGQEV